jgi:hypothetical protein
MTGAEERFWAYVDKSGPVPEHRPELGPCAVWTGSLDEKGYGRFWADGRPRKAHDYAYEITFGPVPDGLEPDHLCRNRACVNAPGGHLEAVTHRENCQRAAYAEETCSEGHQLPEPGPDGRRVCRICANRRSQAHKRRKKASAPPKAPRPIVHGRSRYTHHGCRCDVCCDAENEYKRNWRRRQSPERIYDAVMGHD